MQWELFYIVKVLLSRCCLRKCLEPVMVNHNQLNFMSPLPSPSKLVSLSLYVDFYARSILWRKMFFWLVTSVGQRKKFWVPLRNQTSNLWISQSDALPLSHRDSMVSKAHCEVIYVHIQHLSCILLGLAMLLILTVIMQDTFSLCHACDKTKNIFLYFFTRLKTYHLPYSICNIFWVPPSNSYQSYHSIKVYKQYKAISNDRKIKFASL